MTWDWFNFIIFHSYTYLSNQFLVLFFPNLTTVNQWLHEHYGASEVKIVLEKNIKCDKLRSD